MVTGHRQTKNNQEAKWILMLVLDIQLPHTTLVMVFHKDFHRPEIHNLVPVEEVDLVIKVVEKTFPDGVVSQHLGDMLFNTLTKEDRLSEYHAKCVVGSILGEHQSQRPEKVAH
eukprot:CAMPEP_0117027004 /NCGR_PEP_ID=MMETSP0472-20121206/19795_1 /TAXON_ID=693140 ORGANISM="Tiarina fusus, Strain LIS" /NCGR_SAMPLE_ID=MMETSP0472 /ASSEMBLY_ACC=CAM_ASM_000603 /LENGTH=113 /DNA_ID=CAMNT_0004734161 /DNA_START=1388 /DNA_END=1726 /DNA_ORIENTATION=-